jgi:hypothetical protein
VVKLDPQNQEFRILVLKKMLKEGYKSNTAEDAKTVDEDAQKAQELCYI